MRKHGHKDRQRNKARTVRKVLSEGRAKHGQPDVVHTIPVSCHSSDNPVACSTRHDECSGNQ